MSINLYMNQIPDNKTDIYQILSHCLGSLKRKVVLYLKICVHERNLNPQPQLLEQLSKECQYSEALLSEVDSDIFNQQSNSILQQRFIGRIKELIRNFLPHASKSHELFMFFKKIETLPLKVDFKLKNYISMILLENPPYLQAKIQKCIQSRRQSDKECLYQEYKQGFRSHSNAERLEVRRPKQSENPSIYKNTLQVQNRKNLSESVTFRTSKGDTLLTDSLTLKSVKHSLNESMLLPKRMEKSEKQSLNLSTNIKKNQRPIDIFYGSVKALDCIEDFEVSDIRSIYFKYKRQRQIGVYEESTVLQAQNDMLDRNRYVKNSIDFYDKIYAKYMEKLRKNSKYDEKSKRCQTADLTSRRNNGNGNASILSNYEKRQKQKTQVSQKHNSTFKLSKQTSFASQQQKADIYKQLADRKNNVLKMNSITLSNQSGNLELCVQNKRDRVRVLAFNTKRAFYKHTASNLKRRYENFMNHETINREKIQKQSKKYSTIENDGSEKSPKRSICVSGRDWNKQKTKKFFEILNPELTVTTCRKS